jgi:hypothetical protein
MEKGKMIKRRRIQETQDEDEIRSNINKAQVLEMTKCWRK